MTEPPAPRLIPPATPHADEGSSDYLPSVPWRWIALGAITVGVLVVAYRSNESSKVDALRAGLVRLHQGQLGEASAKYQAFADDLAARIEWAGRTTPQPHIDAQLSINGLRKAPGLYLRIPRDAARDRAHIRDAALSASADVIGACLGLAPLSVRGLYERGEFLLPSWLDEARDTDSVLRLRVIDDDLVRRVKRDLPSVLALMQSRWFLLVLEHGRRDAAPVDVFLWDLREADPLLQTRVRSQGALLSARVRDGRSAPKLTPEDAGRSGAHDCSIASQIKALAGSPAAEIAGTVSTPGP